MIASLRNLEKDRKRSVDPSQQCAVVAVYTEKLGDCSSRQLRLFFSTWVSPGNQSFQTTALDAGMKYTLTGVIIRPVVHRTYSGSCPSAFCIQPGADT